MHIGSLLMAFFFRFMRPLVDAGHLYLGLSPLYRIKFGSGAKEEVFWVYSDEEKEKVLKGRTRGQVSITRFKGLGEMNASTLWETTINPKTRNILKIQVVNDAETTQVLENLLGKDTGERYRMIQENADRLEVDV